MNKTVTLEFIFVLCFGLIVGALVSTHAFAWHVGMQSALGDPVYVYYPVPRFRFMVPVYMPWRIALWLWQWGFVEFMKPSLIFGGISFVAVVGFWFHALLSRGKSMNLWRKTAGTGTIKDIRDNRGEGVVVSSKPVSGIVLGGMGWKKTVTLTTAAPVVNAVAFGGPGSGKSRSVIMPTLARWRGSAFVYDPKGELAAETAEIRKGFSGIIELSFDQVGGPRFNPLSEIRRDPNMMADIKDLVMALVASSGGHASSSSAVFFKEAVAGLLEGIVLHLLSGPGPYTLSDVARLVAHADETMDAMAASKNPWVKAAAASYAALSGGKGDTRSGIMLSARNLFGAFSDPAVAAQTAESDFRLTDLICGMNPVTCYLKVRPSRLESLKPLLRVFLTQVGQVMAEEPQTARGLRKRSEGLLMVVDEAGQIGNIPTLENLLRLGRGYGLKMLMAFQSPKDMAGIYGRDNTILGCMRAEVHCAIDPEYANELERRLPVIQEKKESVSRVGWGKQTKTIHLHDRPTLRAADLIAINTNKQFVRVGSLPPFILDKITFVWAKRASSVEDSAASVVKIETSDEHKPVASVQERLAKRIRLIGISETKAAATFFPDIGAALARHWISGRRELPEEHRIRLEPMLDELEAT